MIVHETDALPVPPWLADMEFCHIDDGTGEHAYCNEPAADGPITCSDYAGKALCATCGNPICPRCAQLASLDDQLDDT